MDDGVPQKIPEYVNWWEEFESSHDAPQAPHIDGAGGQSGRIGFLLAPWNSQKKSSGRVAVADTYQIPKIDTNCHFCSKPGN